MEEAPLVGEGKGAGEENAPASSEQNCSLSFLGRSSCIRGPVTAHGRTRWETEIQSTMPGAQGVMKRMRQESPAGGPESDWGFMGGFW